MSNRRSESGAVLPLVAISLLTLVGFLGLAIDGAFLVARKTQLQNTADSAALACVIKNQGAPGTCNNSNYTTQLALYKPSSTNLTASIPTTCPQPWQSHCVAITATSTWNTWFMKALGHSTITSNAQAIAGRNNPCLFGLATTGNTIDFNGRKTQSGTINCLISSLSTSAASIRNSGGGNISTNTGIITKGGISGTIISPSTITNSTAALTDPYIGQPTPQTSPCSGDTLINTCTPVNSGCYSSLTISPPNGCNLTINPGIYVITPKQLIIDSGSGAGATITGTNVNFYVDRGPGSGPSVTIQGSGSVSLTASKYGAYANMLFVVPYRNGLFTGSGARSLIGSTYLPTGKITIDATNTVTTGNLVANEIAISSDLTLNDTSRIKLLQ